MTLTAEHVYTPRGVLKDLFSCRENEVLVAGPAGTGKAQPVDATVWTPSGPVRMGSLEVGDEILTPTGRAKVRAIHSRGVQPIYRVTFTGGDSTECTEDHLWALVHYGGGKRNGKRVREMPTVQRLGNVAADYLLSDRRRPKYWIPQTAPVEFDPRPIPIPAYTLGVLLGDGHIHRGRGIAFTSADPEIAERVRAEMAGRYRLSIGEKRGNAAVTYRIVADGWHPTRPGTAKRGYIGRTGSGKWSATTRVSDGRRYLGSFASRALAEVALADADVAPPHDGDGLGYLLDTLGLENTYAWDKFVPDCYKRNTVDVRLAILQGLMDTDGTVDRKTGTPSFTSTSERLAHDVKEIAESLGGICRITTKKTSGRLAYTCWIRHDHTAQMFHLERKRARTRARTKYPVKRMLLSIEPAGFKDCCCIEVDGGLYLTDNFIVTHNSLACLQKLHMLALLNAGMRGLIVRKTLASLGSTALVTWREKVIAEALESGAVKFYGGSPQESPQYKYANGSVIVVGGMDRAVRVMSSEYDAIYVQESTELVEDDWEALTTRLRHGKISFQQLIADCNPAQPTHWLKARCDRGSTVMLESRHEDNPTLFSEAGKLTDVGASYIGKLDALTGVRYLRLRKGLWAAADGLVYEEWDPNTHLVNGPKMSSGRVTWPPEDWDRYWSVDFGYIHPMVIQMWAQDPDGVLYLYRELYRCKTTVDQMAKLAIDAVTFKDWKYSGPLEHAYQGRRWKEPKPRAVICDHDAENRAVLERELGMSTTAAKKTVADGIQAVKQRLREKRLFVCRDSLADRDTELAESHRPTCFADEVLGYAWDTAGGKKLKDAPVKVEDDAMDTMRYMVAHLDLKARSRIRWMG